MDHESKKIQLQTKHNGNGANRLRFLLSISSNKETILLVCFSIINSKNLQGKKYDNFCTMKSVKRIILSTNKEMDFPKSMVPGPRLMTMSPLYPFGEPCSTGNHNKTVKKLTLFSAIIKMLRWNHGFESRIPSECYQFFHGIVISITFAVTIVIQKSCHLIGTQGSSEFGPK